MSIPQQDSQILYPGFQEKDPIIFDTLEEVLALPERDKEDRT